MYVLRSSWGFQGKWKHVWVFLRFQEQGCSAGALSIVQQPHRALLGMGTSCTDIFAPWWTQLIRSEWEHTESSTVPPDVWWLSQLLEWDHTWPGACTLCYLISKLFWNHMIVLVMTARRASLGGLSAMAGRCLECSSTLNTQKVLGGFVI